MASPTDDDLLANALLGILREGDRRRLAPHMMVFDLESGAELQRAGDNVVHTWFPLGPALAGFSVDADQDHSVEVALIGREGAIGGIVSNGGVPAFASSHVRFPGRFLRIKTIALEQAKIESVALRHWFSRYSDCLLAQVFQSAACNASHTVTQRAAKWLLAAAERTRQLEFTLTQDDLAEMLGVGRPFVSRIVAKLREERILGTRRGHFIISDEGALRARSCHCTTVVQNHFDEVLHGIYVVEQAN